MFLKLNKSIIKSLFLGIWFWLLLMINKANSQIINLPYSFELDQKVGKLIYSTDTKYHTSSKSYMYGGRILSLLDSIQSSNPVSSKNWFARKLFNEHLIQVNKEDHSFYADFLPDMFLGKDVRDDRRKVWMNSRGVQAGLIIKEKLSFYTSFYEAQAIFPEYLDNYINDHKVIPGQGGTKFQSNNKKDWMYSTANLTYDFSEYFQATIAYDKNFIGDGYRSMLLSDFSSNYTHLKFRGTIGNVQYTSITAYMNDPKNPKYNNSGTGNSRLGDGVKWGTFHYLDWNASNKLSVGLFQGLVWSQRDNRIDRPENKNLSNNRGKGDNVLIGFTSKYKISHEWTTYGQIVFGGLNTKELFSGKGYAGNKLAGQFGVRGHDILGVKNLNVMVEFNTARPYIYSNNRPVSNYSNNAEPLAHPQGANFREILAIANYSWNRLLWQVKGVYVRKGLDDANNNYGGDIFKSYKLASIVYGNSIGQGIRNNEYYTEAKAAYVLNPKYNLRLEFGYSWRNSKVYSTKSEINESGTVTFGLRSSFRNIYNDF